MTDDEFQANLMRDLCAISNFGILEEMLADLRVCGTIQNSEASRTPPEIPPIPKRSRVKCRGRRVVIAPDYDPPSAIGQAAVLEELVEGHGYDNHSLSQELLEIDSGSYRNESIEAYLEEEYLKRQMKESYLSNSDDDKSFISVVGNIAKEPLSGGEKSPAPASPVEALAEKSPPAQKAKKSKKKRNAVLLSYLANANKRSESEGEDGAAVAGVEGESVSAAPPVKEEDANDDAYVLEGKIDFEGIGDSPNSSEIEVESQESYLVDDESASDNLQASVEALTDVSVDSTASKSSDNSKKGDSENSGKSKKSSSRSSYHRTSNRNRVLAKSPLPLLNPAVGRKSPLIRDFYVPHMVTTKFTYSKHDFPPL